MHRSQPLDPTRLLISLEALVGSWVARIRTHAVSRRGRDTCELPLLLHIVPRLPAEAHPLETVAFAEDDDDDNEDEDETEDNGKGNLLPEIEVAQLLIGEFLGRNVPGKDAGGGDGKHGRGGRGGRGGNGKHGVGRRGSRPTRWITQILWVSRE